MATMTEAAKSGFNYLAAPFPYFGGKSKAAPLVWSRFGDVKNYVEPFCGSAAMLLCSPEGTRTETINDADGFVSNFWRAVRADPEAVAYHADFPVSETDLFARHGWLVNRAERLKWSLEDPDFYDAKIAGWWVWGACNWIGGGWCAGKGPWVSNGSHIVDSRKLPHLGNAGQGRYEFIFEWMMALSERLRDVRIVCGDWLRVADSSSVTVRHGLTGVFLDPPYTKGAMDYAAGGVGGELAHQVTEWCAENVDNKLLRVALCGHAGEHSALESLGWRAETWKAGGGYARTKEAVENRKSETIWFSPACVFDEKSEQDELLELSA